jgi:hypothetical protein
MISERKLLWLAWYYRITLLFGIFGLMFSGYVHTFMRPNILKSYGSITVAFAFGMLFFSSFPEHRLNVRFYQFKKKLAERNGFNETTQLEISSKNKVRCFRKYTALFVTMFVFVILNILLAIKANSNDNHPGIFLHMVIITTAFFLFNASLTTYRVDETFKKIEGLIFQYEKDQTLDR